MSQEKTFRINLPTLFERVNERRKEQGLPPVEPAVMAVRASIKFAIRRQKPLNLKDEDTGEVEMDEGDADALCQTLGDLFNVDLHYDEDDSQAGPATEPRAALPLDSAAGAGDGATFSLPLFQFYAAINRERRAKNLRPIEPAVISVRTGIKISIMRRRALNFRGDELLLDRADLEALDDIVAQQFDVVVPNGLLSHCRSLTSGPQPAKADADAAVADAKPEGFLVRLMNRLSGKQGDHVVAKDTHHYTLDTSALLLAIVTRRAYLGHKPITPDRVRSRCGKALSAELELEVDMDDPRIALQHEQLDAFAEIIRSEFEIMFEDLDDLLGKNKKP